MYIRNSGVDEPLRGLSNGRTVPALCVKVILLSPIAVHSHVPFNAQCPHLTRRCMNLQVKNTAAW